MQFGDVLASPIIWVLTVICIIGCVYANRSVVVGIICGVIAPMVVIPIWVIAALAINVPHLLVRTLFPELVPFLEKSSSAWAGVVVFLTDPGNLAVFITAVLFVWYCIVGRKNCHRPAAFTPTRSRLTASNPFIRRFWH